MSEQANIAELYKHHWALDGMAAEHLAKYGSGSGMEAYAMQVVAGLGKTAIEFRDGYRDEIGAIFTRTSDKSLIVVGPCSLDVGNDYGPLFDYIAVLQEQNPTAVVAMRANGAKPRSSGGWTGLVNSTDPAERARLVEIYKEAFERNIPLLTEVTQDTQLFKLAPYLSGFWLGARDVPSTTLRTAASAYHLPVAVKNGQDGSVKGVRGTVEAIRRSTAQNDGSGFCIGFVADGEELVLPIGEGNQQVAIIARGYQISGDMSPKKRYEKAISHLSDMCVLGAEMNCAVELDGSHDVPEMFDIPRKGKNQVKDSDRLIRVLEIIHEAIEKGRIERHDVLSGILAEIGVDKGRTDPNFVLDKGRKNLLAKLIKKTTKLLEPA